MDQIVTGLNIRLVALSLAIAMLSAWQIGKRMGLALHIKGHPKPSKFDDASMALLGLLLAFTFGSSIAKHDKRRMAVVTDSNAIGDFYTCASLLKEPTRTKLQSVIRQYAQLRLRLTQKRLAMLILKPHWSRFDGIHKVMTDLVRQALSDGTPIAVSLTNSLNAVSSNQASRLAAYRDRLPGSVVVLLFASAVITTLPIGREQASADNPEVAGTLCFILLTSIAVFVTLDLNRPERGLIRVSQEPIQRLVSATQE